VLVHGLLGARDLVAVVEGGRGEGGEAALGVAGADLLELRLARFGRVGDVAPEDRLVAVPTYSG
jgi:hypothetical protein